MTEFDFKILAPKINANHKLFFIGSCFSENIAKAMKSDKLDVYSNPFGVIFHPEAILNVLKKSLEGYVYKESDFFKWDNYWFCYDHHSELANVNLLDYISTANQILKTVKETLVKTDFLFITLGSAWGYENNGKIVANCHQQNGNLFVKRLLNKDLIKIEFVELINQIKQINPSINICFTVSPVRHIKDGLINNQISKSTLILLSHELCLMFKAVFYFPSYEFVIDHLRDYSYYKIDGIHPNNEAVLKTYQLFKSVFFDTDLQKRTEIWNGLKLSMEHRTFRPLSESNKKFKINLIRDLQLFSEKYQVNVDQELLKFQIG